MDPAAPIKGAKEALRSRSQSEIDNKREVPRKYLLRPVQDGLNVAEQTRLPPAVGTSPKISPKDAIMEGEGGPRLFATTYATHGGRDDRFCRAVESSIRSGIDLIILGWGEEWHGLSQKLDAAHRFAKSLRANDILLFTDAYDVLFLDSNSNIQRVFEEFVTGEGSQTAPIVFSAECGCWPHVMVDRQACFKTYPESPTPYRYLNSGTWVGRAGQAEAMLRDVIKEAGRDFRNANDQKLVADMYIAGRHNIKLDFYNKIFQSMHMTLDPPLKHCNPTKDVQIDSNGRLWTNHVTHSSPKVIHFNGGGKSVHLKMEGKMWWKQATYSTVEERSKLAAHKIQVPNQKSGYLRFDQLCPNYDP